MPSSARRQLKASVAVALRLAPHRRREVLANVVRLADPDIQADLCAALLDAVEVPATIRICPSGPKRRFIASEFNRDENAYRSPFINEYIAKNGRKVAGHYRPDGPYRRLEELANECFGEYARQYYGSGGLCSCYVWDAAPDAVADGAQTDAVKDYGMAVQIVNEVPGAGTWHITHVVTSVVAASQRQQYSVYTSLFLNCTTAKPSAESTSAGAAPATTLRFSGTVSRSSRTFQQPVRSLHDHVVNIGNHVQKTEARILNKMDGVYFGKAQHIASELRDNRTMTQRHVAEKLHDISMAPSRTSPAVAPAPPPPPPEATHHHDPVSPPPPAGSEEGTKNGKGSATPEAVSPSCDTPSPEPEGSHRKRKDRCPWAAAQDDEGNTYYYNAETEETSWEKPPELAKYEKRKKKEKAARRLQELDTFLAGIRLSQHYTGEAMGVGSIAELYQYEEAQMEALGVEAFGDRRKIAKALLKYYAEENPPTEADML